MDWSNKGIMINGRRLNHLCYANDIVIITDNPEDLKTMLEKLAQQSSKAGSDMNLQ